MFWYPSVKRADEAATATSHASAIENPAPAATPLTAATTGFGARRSVAIRACSPMASPMNFPGPSFSNAANDSTSPPAENAFPVPVRTTHRTDGSAETSETADRSASPISWL